MESELLSVTQVAAVLSVSEGTVRNLVRRGELPEPRKVGGRLRRWFRRDVDEYLSRLRYGPPSPPAP